MDKDNKPKVVLRALEPEDLDLLYGIENNPEVWDVSPTNVPYSRYVLHNYLANTVNDRPFQYCNWSARSVSCA